MQVVDVSCKDASFPKFHMTTAVSTTHILIGMCRTACISSLRDTCAGMNNRDPSNYYGDATVGLAL